MRLSFFTLFITFILLNSYAARVPKKTKSRTAHKRSAHTKDSIPKIKARSLSAQLYQILARPPYVDTCLRIAHDSSMIDTCFSKGWYRFLIHQLADSLRAPTQYTSPETAAWTGALHFGLRTPDMVILHHTAHTNVRRTKQIFNMLSVQASAHYLIERDGTIHPLISEYLRSWHAGRAKWGNIEDINSISIGIELDNDGKDSFPDVQIQSLLRLLSSIKSRHKIPQGNFLGHGDIAPGRKVDPHALFPWKTLAQEGFGFWYDDTVKIKTLPENFDPLAALRIIGYDTRRREAAARAFRRHFLGVESKDGKLSEKELKILFQVYKKYW